MLARLRTYFAKPNGNPSAAAIFAALLVVIAQPSANLLHGWQSAHSVSACAEVAVHAGHDGGSALHAEGCAHQHGKAHHDANACPVCQTLQHTAHGIATASSDSSGIHPTIGCGGLPFRIPPSPALDNSAAPRAPPTLA